MTVTLILELVIGVSSNTTVEWSDLSLVNVWPSTQSGTQWRSAQTPAGLCCSSCWPVWSSPARWCWPAWGWRWCGKSSRISHHRFAPGEVWTWWRMMWSIDWQTCGVRTSNTIQMILITTTNYLMAHSTFGTFSTDSTKSSLIRHFFPSSLSRTASSKSSPPGTWTSRPFLINLADVGAPVDSSRTAADSRII